MKIILLKDSTQANSSACVAGRKLALGAICLLVLLPVSLGLSSYWLVATIDRSINPFVDPEYRNTVEASVREQQEQMVNTREYVQKNLDILGRKIGSLQAQVSRINAVEMQIAEVAGLDISSFNFDQDPPVGGMGGVGKPSKQQDIEKAITAIEQELEIRESEIAMVDFLLSTKQLQDRQTPAGWPVKGGWVSSSFGSRLHPLTGHKDFHRGVDIPGKLNADVLAVADGVVRRSEKKGNYGWLVEIDHGDGFVTLYSHNKSNLVKVGETVDKGQPIAKLGSTGRSTGPHVHFEVKKNGRNINPIKYLYRKA